MVARVAVSVLAMLAACNVHAANIRGGSSITSHDSDQLRPDVVANTLVNVEDEWRKQAADFTEGTSAGSKAAPDAFAKSCSTVVSAVIQGSGGDRNVAKEYMGRVCSQKTLGGWRGVRCTALAASITDHAMLADSYANRQNLSPMKACTSFWSVFVEAERNREAEEAKERAEKEKVRAEQEKKEAAIAAEAQKEAEAAAKIEAEKRAKEEAQHKQEEKEQQAKVEAAEAKARAAEAAVRLAEKRAEAEKVQKEAQLKLEEATNAEKEHKDRLAEHKKAEDLLKDATKSAPSTKTAPEPAAPKPAALAAPKPAAPKPEVEATPAAPKPTAETTGKDTVVAAAASKSATSAKAAAAVKDEKKAGKADAVVAKVATQGAKK